MDACGKPTDMTFSLNLSQHMTAYSTSNWWSRSLLLKSERGGRKEGGPDVHDHFRDHAFIEWMNEWMNEQK